MAPSVDKKPAEEELSDEDQQLKADLESLVEVLNTTGTKDGYSSCLVQLKNHIKDSTSSMTAVPKPLKFLRPHYTLLTSIYDKWTDDELKLQFADVLSVLGMTYDESNFDSLNYRLVASFDNMIDWGFEYIRHLSLEVGEVFQDSDAEKQAQLVKLSLNIIPHFLRHNAEADAIDLLLELEQIEKLIDFIDKDSYNRVCQYMLQCVPLLSPPDDLNFLNTCFTIYLNNNELAQALTIAIKLNDMSLIEQVFNSTDDVLVQKQMAFILATNNSPFKHSDPEIQNLISNQTKSELFQYLNKELNLLDVKLPEDIYKSHLETSKFNLNNIDSAKQNLASSFVNGFVNLGFGNDKLVSVEDSKSWIYKTKGAGMLSTTASIGLINEWDINNGLQTLDKYLYSNEDEVKAGALLGMGVLSSSVHDDVEPALLILQDYVTNQSSKSLSIAAINGLGIAFANSQNEDVLNLLLPLISDLDQPIEISALATLALGHVFISSCNGDITSTILQTLLERDFSALTSKWIRFISLGLGLLYMGKYDSIDDVLETIDAISHPIAKNLKVMVNICSYVGTGNVLQIQTLLQMLTPKASKSDIEKEVEEEETKEEEDDEDKEKDEEEEKEEDKSYQAYAVLGIAMIAMGEEIGQDMALRHFSHLMHYGDYAVKRAVPLAMGLVSCSNPQMKVFDTLSRYSHDVYSEVAQISIYAMGLVGSGTNNARLDQLLRSLAGYYAKDPDTLFIVRIAQGLIHLGKGTLSLNPFNTDRSILSNTSLAALLTVSLAFLDPAEFILEDYHSLLYYLTPAIKPKWLISVDENLNPIKVNVRVGQAVDTVGQAGKPKTITGWVTHSTPVLLNFGERAELENDEYLSLASVLEGVVILKKNPDYMDLDN